MLTFEVTCLTLSGDIFTFVAVSTFVTVFTFKFFTTVYMNAHSGESLSNSGAHFHFFQSRKHITERQRRARINSYLEEIQSLVPNSTNSVSCHLFYFIYSA